MAKIEIPAFYFQQVLHQRKYSPKKALSYKNKKQRALLRREFARKCIFCRRSDSLHGKDQFGVDHYKPQSKFPDLVNEYSNLFHACNTCNRLKRDFWPSSGQASEGIFIPNPCDHVMAQHLKFVGHDIKSQSLAGKWTIELLHLNDTQSINHRKLLNNIYFEYKYKLGRIEKQIKKNENVLSKSSQDPLEKSQLKDKQSLLIKKANEISSNLFRLIG
jgi:hypothetical protein